MITILYYLFHVIDFEIETVYLGINQQSSEKY